MRTFTRPIPVTAAIQWLENGRTNLYALVDPSTAMAIRVGKLETVEAHNKTKGRNKQWHIMSYPDIRAFHKAAAPSPKATNNVPIPAVKPVTLPTAAPVATQATTVASEAHSAAMEELTKVSEQLIESIVDARLKEAVELQAATSKPDLPPGAIGLIAEIRKLEKHGLSVLAQVEAFNKHNPTWSHVGMVNFQQATMAMVKSLTNHTS